MRNMRGTMLYFKDADHIDNMNRTKIERYG